MWLTLTLLSPTDINRQALQTVGPNAIEPSPRERRTRRTRRVVWGVSAAALLGASPFLAPWFWATAVTALMITPMLFAVRDLGPGWSDLNDAWKAAENGDLDTLEQTYMRILQTAGTPAIRLTAMHDLGYVARRKGELDRAMSIFDTVWSKSKRKAHKRICASNLAVCHALKGDEDAAMVWLDRSKGLRAIPPSHRAIVLARFGHYEEVTALRPVNPAPWRRMYLFHALRVLALMKAFAAHQLGRDKERVMQLHQAACPAYSSEYDYLAANWDALRAFLQAHPWQRRAPQTRSTVPRTRLLELVDKHRELERQKRAQRLEPGEPPHSPGDTTDNKFDNIS